MEKYTYINLRQRPQLKELAAAWFHSKWNVPQEAYLERINAYLNLETEYSWYLCLHGKKIAGGVGVIENDFHNRKDLAPNVCALYTEQEYSDRRPRQTPTASLSEVLYAACVLRTLKIL